MRRNNAVRRSDAGLPLVELLIIAVIIGILASIGIPKRSNASAPARESSPGRIAPQMSSSVKLAGSGISSAPHTYTSPRQLSDSFQG
jgi:Tfp pilus assembly protein FimT